MPARMSAWDSAQFQLAEAVAQLGLDDGFHELSRGRRAARSPSPSRCAATTARSRCCTATACSTTCPAGPAKGGIRYHPATDLDEVTRARDVDDLEVRADRHPVRRRQGRRHRRPAPAVPQRARTGDPPLRLARSCRSSARRRTSRPRTSAPTSRPWPGSWTPTRCTPATRSPAWSPASRSPSAARRAAAARPAAASMYSTFCALRDAGIDPQDVHRRGAGLRQGRRARRAVPARRRLHGGRGLRRRAAAAYDPGGLDPIALLRHLRAGADRRWSGYPGHRHDHQ